jgi:hypothetical protein
MVDGLVQLTAQLLATARRAATQTQSQPLVPSAATIAAVLPFSQRSSQWSDGALRPADAPAMTTCRS